MHIVLYHHARIPPLKYGGTERIVYWLGKALIQKGHRVTLIAREGSNIPGATVLSVAPGDSWEKHVPEDADLIHLWATPHTAPKNKPFLVTIQGNGKPGESFLPNTVFISRKHAENHSSTHFVYNGIDPDEYPCDSHREDRLVFLAKASWKVKNLAGAIEIARAVNLPLEVLGSRELPFRAQRLLPRWRGVKYYGMVDDVEKRAVLRRSRALLFPVRWPEPFGIALTEALASGCAVFGTPYGSLPEIVDRSCGFLSNDASEIVQAIRTQTFPPETCRDRVFQGFTHLNMADAYLNYYDSILRSGALSKDGENHAPKALFTESVEVLLGWKNL
jgi:glycosyltransferase involved in cell wall biosynthesis